MAQRPLGNYCVAVCLVAFAATTAHAQTTLYWSGNGTTQGGNGTWDTTLTRWGTVVGGPYTTVWNNSNNDTARFGGSAAGNATLGTNITVGGLWFDTTGYRIDNSGSTLSFGAANNPITFNNIAAATISGQLGGSNNVSLSTTNPATTGTLTLNGTSTGGWSGSTALNAGMTLTLAESNQGGNSTSAITLNGGGITLTNTAGNATTNNRINDGAAITSNGGTLTYTNTSGASVYAETIGTVGLVRGQTNFVLTTNQASTGNQTLTIGTGGLARSGASNSSAVTFSSGGGLNATKNMIVVTGGGNTTAGQIVGPWATVGTAANAQTDYAIYSSSQVVGANIAGSAQDTWTNAANAYTTSAGATVTLNGTRTITALRNTGASTVLTLASGANLETYGLLNSVGSTLTVAPGTGGVLTTAVGGGKLYVTTGSGGVTISAPINDNGGEVVLVKNGSAGTLTLSSTTSNYSGGTVLNAGRLDFTVDSNLGSTFGGITFNGDAILNGLSSPTLNASRTFTINDGAIATINANGSGLLTVNGQLTGSGALTTSGSHGVHFMNANNTFTGSITTGTSNSTGYGFGMASISDVAGVGLINLGRTTDGGTFRWLSSSGATTTLVNRQFALSGTTGGGIISGIGTTAASNLVVTRDLLVTGVGNKSLTLAGTNTGNNTFSGLIADGTDGGASVVSLTKAEAGRWILTANNTYTGATTISGGSLQVSTLANAGAASSIGAFATPGAGGLLLSGGTLLYTGGNVTTNRGFTQTTSSGINIGGATAANLTLGNSSISNVAGNLLTLSGTPGSSLTISGNVVNNVSGTNPWNIDAGINLTISGVVSGVGGIGRRNGVGVVTLNNDSNSFTGPINTNANAGSGALIFTSIADYGVNSALGQGTSGTAYTLGGNQGAAAPLTYIGAGNSTNRQFDLGASASIVNNGTGALTFTGLAADSNNFIRANGATAAGTRTLTLDGSYTGAANVISGTIINTNGAALVAVTKAGASTWTLSANNTYTGATSVNGGTLRLDYGTNNTSKLSDTAALTLGGGTLDLTGGSHTEVVASTTLTASTASALVRPSGASILQMNLITNNSGTVDFGADNLARVLNTNTNGILGAWSTVGGADWATSAATSNSSVSSNATTDTISLPGMTNGNSIRFTANAPAGVTVNTVYYVINATGSDFQISTTPGGSAVNMTADGSTGVVNVAGAVTAYTSYTANLTRQSSGTKAIPNTSTANVRIIEGTGGSPANLTLAAATTSINTLNQSISGGAGDATISLPGQTLRTDGILMGPTSGNLTIGTAIGSGTLSSTTGTGSVIVANNSSNLLTINSVIASNTTTGLVKTGAGVLVLTANSTYTGGTTLQDGIIRAGATTGSSNGLLGSTSITGLTIANKATALFDLNNFDVTVKDLSGGGSSGGNVTLGTGRLTINNPSNGATPYNGTISGTGGLTVNGSSSWNTFGAHTYTGNTTVGSGAVLLITSILADGGVASGIGQSTSAAGNLVFTGGSVSYNGTAAGSTDRQFTLAGNGGFGVEGAGAITWSNTAAVTYSGAGTRTLSFVRNGTGLGTFAAAIGDNAGSAVSVTKTGTSNWTLTNSASTFTGAITLNTTTSAAGILSYASAGGNNTITFNQTTSTATLSYIGSANRTMSGAISANALSSGTITLDSSGAGAINYSNTGSLGVGGASGNKGLVLSGSNLGDNTLAGVWANNTAGGVPTLTKSGAGKWILSGNNTYNGTTTINAGTLQLGTGGTSGAFTGTGSVVVASGAVLALNRSDTAGQGASGALGNSAVISGAGSVRLMGGAGGTGVVTMSQANTFTGGVTLDAGTLQINSVGSAGTNGPLGNGGVFTVNGGSIDTTSADRVVLNVNPISVAGNFTFVGTNNLTLPGAVSFGGADRTITTTANTLTLSGVLQNGGLIKAGAGSLVLAGANSYTGATTVSQGTLRVNGSLGGGSAVTVLAGATLGGNGTIYGPTTIQGSHSPGNSPGVQTFSSNLTYSGGNASVNWELVGNTITNTGNTTYDQIIVNANLDFAAATGLNLTFNGVGSTVLWSDSFWSSNQSWTLHDVAGTTTGFSNLTLNTLNWQDSGSNTLSSVRSSASFNVSQSGQDVLINYVAVPEPATVALAFCGLIGLGVAVRRRFRNKV